MLSGLYIEKKTGPTEERDDQRAERDGSERVGRRALEGTPCNLLGVRASVVAAVESV